MELPPPDVPEMLPPESVSTPEEEPRYEAEKAGQAVELAPLDPSRANSNASTKAAPALPPLMPPPVSTPTTTDVTDKDLPSVAEDADVIEKQWVIKAK